MFCHFDNITHTLGEFWLSLARAKTKTPGKERKTIVMKSSIKGKKRWEKSEENRGKLT